MLEGFKHSQAIALFKEVKCGEIIIQVGRRDLIRRLVCNSLVNKLSTSNLNEQIAILIFY